MIIIYHAANTLDANLIKNLLAQHHIQAFILGEYLQGGVGDLPAADLVKVAIHAQDQVAAQDIIHQWNTGTVLEDEIKSTPEGDVVHGAT